MHIHTVQATYLLEPSNTRTYWPHSLTSLSVDVPTLLLITRRDEVYPEEIRSRLWATPRHTQSRYKRYSRQQHGSFSHWLLYFSQRPRAFTDARVKLSGRLQNSTARTRMCMQIPMSGAQYIEVLNLCGWPFTDAAGLWFRRKRLVFAYSCYSDQFSITPNIPQQRRKGYWSVVETTLSLPHISSTRPVKFLNTLLTGI